MLGRLGWTIAELIYTDRDAAQGAAMVYAKTAPPKERFAARRSCGGMYEINVLPVGRSSQLKMNQMTQGSSADSAAAQAKKIKMQAALKRTQPAVAKANGATRRPRESTGETPERSIRPASGETGLQAGNNVDVSMNDSFPAVPAFNPSGTG